MQLLSVYLYHNNLDVILDLDPYVRGVNQVMYQRDLTIQKGLKNVVRVQFKNSDQKRIQIHNTQTFVFTIFDSTNQRVLVEKSLDVLDQGTTSTRGLAQLMLTESETLNLNKSSYTYSIKCLDQDNSFTPAYTNTYYGINGTLHLMDDVVPVFQPSTEVTNFLPSYNSSTDLYEFKSRALYASPEYNSGTGNHTFAVYLTNYRGEVQFRGTLNNDPNDLAYYSVITSKFYNGFTGVDCVNVNGIYSYVDIIHIPNIGPMDLDNLNNIEYRGTLDKVLYRS
jgi:hypothetical protein